MKKNINIFIGGSTNKNISKSYSDFAVELGKKINERKDYEITFDGCLGLPYLVFNELYYTSRAVIYKTRFYGNDYIFNTSARIREFRNQTDFIKNIIENVDAMIFMKGSSSTITELMYIIDAKKNKEHDKPIVILNINDEWKELINLLDTFKLNNIYYVTDNIADCLNYIEKELFSKDNSFNHYINYMDRDKPIIEEYIKK